MKRFVVALSLGSIALFLSSCDIFKGINKIALPMELWIYEGVGDPITCNMHFFFSDLTPDTSGIEDTAYISGSTVNVIIKGTNDGELDQAYSYNDIYFDFGQIPQGSYTLHVETNNSKADDFEFTVAESVYVVKDIKTGKVAMGYGSDTLRRLFPDMLLVELGMDTASIRRRVDTLTSRLALIDGTKADLSAGSYSIFAVSSEGRITADREQSENWQIYSGFDTTTCVVYKFTGDTADLSAFYELYKDTVPGFSLRLGSGFDRCNFEY